MHHSLLGTQSQWGQGWYSPFTRRIWICKGTCVIKFCRFSGRWAQGTRFRRNPEMTQATQGGHGAVILQVPNPLLRQPHDQLHQIRERGAPFPAASHLVSHCPLSTRPHSHRLHFPAPLHLCAVPVFRLTSALASLLYCSLPPPGSLIHGFPSHCSSYPQSAKIWKYHMENSRNKQFITFKLPAVVSSVATSPAVPLRPAQVVNHLFVQLIHTVYTH